MMHWVREGASTSYYQKMDNKKPPHLGGGTKLELAGLKKIGAAGFEPTTPTTPKWCATKLRYAPVAAGQCKLSQRFASSQPAQQADAEPIPREASIAPQPQLSRQLAQLGQGHAGQS
jgi:hypothetical protein